MNTGLYSKTRLASMVLFGLLLVGTASLSATATVITVDRFDDTLTDICHPDFGNDCTLRGALGRASAGDTINFSPLLNGATLNLNAAVEISKNNLTIQGPGANLLTIRSNSGFVFHLFGLPRTGIQINNLRLANCKGGVDMETNASITLNNVVFENLVWPTNVGGEIHALTVSKNSVVMVNNCTFLNNSTGFPQGFNSRNGGAIHNTGTLIVNNSIFQGNSSEGSGGAIYSDVNNNSPVAISISNSYFTNNTAQAGGGAISSQIGSIAIYNSVIGSNTATFGGGLAAVSATVASCLISGNVATVSGGRVYSNGLLTILNSTLASNQAASGGGLASGPGDLFLRHLTVTGNSASDFAGGIYTGGAVTSLANSIVTGNTAPTDPNTSAGGPNNLIGVNAKLLPIGFYGGFSFTYALSCDSPAIDSGNNALAVDRAGNPILTEQRGLSRIYGPNVDIGAVEAAIVSVANVSDNAADAGSLRQAIDNAPDGGTICFDPAFFSTPRTLPMSGGSIFLNKTLIIDGPGSSLLTLDPNFSSRHFTLASGGERIYLNGMKLDRGKSNLSDGNYGSGGAIYNGGFLFSSDLAITNFNDSSGIQNHSFMELRDSSISGGIGSGLSNEANNANLIDRTVISNNTQVQGAGVVNSGTLTITNSTIELNQAAHAPGGSGSAPVGGGIFNFPGAKLYLDRSSVLNNGAQLGAGLYNLGYAELKNSTFSGNHANLTNNGPTADGGAIYAAGNYVGTWDATIDLINVTIAGNSAANSGGGIFMKQIAGSFAVENMANSIVALNTAPNGTNVYGEVISYGYNLIGNNHALSWAGNSPSLAGNIVGPPGSPVDPKFAPFGNYGGPTPMLVLLPNSPAINAGGPSFFLATDQRGVARPVGGISDIGAYERNVTINQTTVFNGVRNVPYLNGNGAQLTATRLGSFAAKGGNSEMLAPMQFSVAPFGGSLPPGLTLSSGGLLSGTPTTSGTFTFVVKAMDTDGAAGAQQYTMTILVPTSAGVSVYGRVLTSNGLGLTNAQVKLTDQLGGVRTAVSSSFGSFQFDELVPGRSYVLTVNSKRFHFEPQVIDPVGAITEIELWPSP